MTSRRLSRRECRGGRHSSHRANERASHGRDSSGEHHANSGRFYNRAEILVIVDSRALSETPNDPTNLVAIKSPVSTELVRKDPLAGDNVGALRSRNQLPGLIADQGSVLFFHSRTPMRIDKHSTSEGGDRGRCR
jgi:hypothetical protein